MQGSQHLRKVGFAFFIGVFMWSNQLAGLKMISISEPLIIRAQKNSPPHIAFEELLKLERPTATEKIIPPSIYLQAGKSGDVKLLFNSMALSEMVFSKQDVQLGDMENNEANSQIERNDWIAELPRSQATRLREATSRGFDVSEDWHGQSWEELAINEIQQSGVLKSTQTGQRIYVAASDSSGANKTNIPQSKVVVTTGDNTYQVDLESAAFVGTSEVNEVNSGNVRVVTGPIEITGGLAVTNDHHIEIIRTNEGVTKELGKVDLRKGIYNIGVKEFSGSVIARLVDLEGKILGEDSFRLSQLISGYSKNLDGPKLRIQPKKAISGVATSFYNSGPVDSVPQKTQVTLLKGANEISLKTDGVVSMENVSRGSTTILRSAAPKHFQTASLIISGNEFRTQLFPESMVNALVEIVAQQRGVTYSGVPPIIWGEALFDGKPQSGVEVVIESDPELQPIYFNQFMLPDQNLKSTSENGLYAFIDVTPGFHSLLGRKNELIFGYQNVMVEEQSVAQGNIQSTAKKESIPLRVIDAFTGENVFATAIMQSLDSEVEINGNFATISMPYLNRSGMMRVQPQSNDYIATRFMYNDQDEYIHVPMVKWVWISAIKSYLRIDDLTGVGYLVGFAPEEDFEVYLAGNDNFDSRNIVYFDNLGRILPQKKGIAGGGFLILNIPEDTQEIVVLGKNSQKIYSRVVPVDANSLSIITFKDR